MTSSSFRNAVLAGLLALASTPALAQTAPKAPAAAAANQPYAGLHKAQVEALLAKPADVVFLDVRRADEISDLGGFPAFLNIQVADLEKYLAYIPKDRAVVTVSNHAHRAIKAEELLKSKGFKTAGAIGVEDYQAEGGKLVGQKTVAAAKPAAAAQ